jgi:hypothetical protein
MTAHSPSLPGWSLTRFLPKTGFGTLLITAAGDMPVAGLILKNRCAGVCILGGDVPSAWVMEFSHRYELTVWHERAIWLPGNCMSSIIFSSPLFNRYDICLDEKTTRKKTFPQTFTFLSPLQYFIQSGGVLYSSPIDKSYVRKVSCLPLLFCLKLPFK